MYLVNQIPTCEQNSREIVKSFKKMSVSQTYFTFKCSVPLSLSTFDNTSRSIENCPSAKIGPTASF